MNRKIVSTLVALCLFVGLQGQAILHTNPVAPVSTPAGYPEMIDKGDFVGITQNASVNGDPWLTGAAWTIGSNVASYDDSGISTLGQKPTYMLYVLETSTNYTLKFDIVAGGGTGLRIRFYSFGDDGVSKEELIAITNYATGSYSLDFTSPGTLTGTGFAVYASNSGDAGTITNISLKKR